jgi:hypothetical protein
MGVVVVIPADMADRLECIPEVEKGIHNHKVEIGHHSEQTIIEPDELVTGHLQGWIGIRVRVGWGGCRACPITVVASRIHGHECRGRQKANDSQKDELALRKIHFFLLKFEH